MVTAPTQRALIKRPFSVAIVPPLLPGRGLLYSFLLHFAILAGSLWIPWDYILPPAAPRMRHAQEIIAESEIHDALILPPTEAPGGSGEPEQQVQGANGRAGLDEGGDSPRHLPQAVYAGPQNIVVTSPKPVSTVQSIKRPDLIAPPKLKYPLKIKSMLQLPASAPIPELVSPIPAAVPIAAEVPLTTEIATVEKPILEVKASTKKSAPASAPAQAPKLKVKQTNLSRLASNSTAMPVLGAQPSSTPAVAVINVVNAPGASSNVPLAELEGAFAIAMSGANIASKVPASFGLNGRGSAVGNGGNGVGDSGSGTRTGKGGNGNGSEGAGGNGTGTGSGLGRGTASAGLGSGGPGSPRGTGAGGNGSGNGAGGTGGTGGGGKSIGPGTGNGGMQGITVSGGGSPRSNGIAVTGGAAMPMKAPSYGITIVASGSSGGAIRDLGVFGRSETVYTVYLSMADAGGGPDCPMQYSVVPGQASNSGGLVTPPYASAKKTAKLPGGNKSAGREVFVRGFIGEDGKMSAPFAVGGPNDDAAKAAIESLQQWQFMPASIEGKVVKVKVLIGIYVGPQ